MGKSGIKTHKKELRRLTMYLAKTRESIPGGKRSRVKKANDEGPDNQQTGKLHEGNEDMVKESRMMTVQEVADLLRISRFSVYNLVKRGELPAVKVLNKLRFNRQHIEEYLNKHEVNTP